MAKANVPGRLAILKDILKTPVFLAILIVSCIAYFFFIRYMIAISSEGLVLVTVPIYLLYLVAITSGLLLTASLYSLRLSFGYRIMGAGSGIVSIATSFIGGLLSSCACSAPILGVIMYDIGFNALGVSSAISFVSANQYPLLSAVILVNLALLYYSLGKTSSSCTIKNGRILLRKK